LKPGIYSEQLKTLAASVEGSGDIAKCNFHLERDNPFCGDRVKLGIDLSQGKVSRVQHQVKACLICKAAAAALQKSATGLSAVELEALLGKLKQMLSQGESPTEAFESPWQNLNIFSPVSAHRSRHSCVLLPFETLAELLRMAGEQQLE
jgi:nitrogen fixation protein NifU and related proteins